MKLNKREIEEIDINFNQIILDSSFLKSSIQYSLTEDILNVFYENLFQIIKQKSKVKIGYSFFPEDEIEKSKNRIIIDGKPLSVGDIIYRNLRKTESIFIITCTIGAEIEKIIRKFFDSGNYIEGYTLDLLASELVELSADYLQDFIEKKFSNSQIGFSNRYSPGYCGWPVSDQKILFSLLPDNFCGIKITENSLMLPIKSISGILAVGKNINKLEYECDICDDSFCYKKRKL
ncbi:MAG: hypothetical protein NZM09_03510 [Ignavibacterium sp.]|nr:hypothetical protein [Ignavibacterium sp.]MDW8374747.1 vitamin B12 dependent-methionine synthase activation domain-containing protein [Ignavibacteriales bacterium]